MFFILIKTVVYKSKSYTACSVGNCIATMTVHAFADSDNMLLHDHI